MSIEAATGPMRPTILAVDDDTTILAILGRLLHPHFNLSLPVKAKEKADARCSGTRIGAWQ